MAEFTKEEREIIAKCRAENGGIIGGIRTSSGKLVLVRRASPTERSRFLTEVSGKDRSNGLANPHKAIALSTIVHPPTREEVELLLAEFSFLCEDVAAKTIEISSGKDVELGEV